MPARITPIDVENYADKTVYECGFKVFKNNLVKYRFLNDVGLKATVCDNGNKIVEMVVENEQLFGRCSCAAGSRPCEHKVAMLLAWLDDPSSFISFHKLRKAIRELEKNTLVELFMNLAEAFPELGAFFVHDSAEEELQKMHKDVAAVLDFPEEGKVNSFEVMEICKILFIRARYLRHENKWNHARTLLFEVLNSLLQFIDTNRLTPAFPDGYLADIADDYEELTLADPDFAEHQDAIRTEYEKLLSYSGAEYEGILLDQLASRLKND